MNVLRHFIAGGFLAEVDQYWVQYHVVMLFFVLLLLEFFFLPETLYPRKAMLAAELSTSPSVQTDAGKQALYQGSGLIRTKDLGYFVSHLLHGRPAR